MAASRSILLASASPRRRWLLQAACFDVTVVASNADETWPGGDIDAGTIDLARRKLQSADVGSELAVAADTVVVLDDQPMGKPLDAADAERMLERLAGRKHRVVTGYCLSRGESWREGAVSTTVVFRSLSADEIKRYIETGEPLDKAGAYAIQGSGGALVDRIEGSYTNVVGLPLAQVCAAVEELP